MRRIRIKIIVYKYSEKGVVDGVLEVTWEGGLLHSNRKSGFSFRV